MYVTRVCLVYFPLAIPASSKKSGIGSAYFLCLSGGRHNCRTRVEDFPVASTHSGYQVLGVAFPFD